MSGDRAAPVIITISQPAEHEGRSSVRRCRRAVFGSRMVADQPKSRSPKPSPGYRHKAVEVRERHVGRGGASRTDRHRTDRKCT